MPVGLNKKSPNTVVLFLAKDQEKSKTEKHQNRKLSDYNYSTPTKHYIKLHPHQAVARHLNHLTCVVSEKAK